MIARSRPDVPRLDARPVTPGPDVERAFAAIDGNTIAKILFTSGSTGTPKGVVNTQGMLCANQAALAAGWPFVTDAPPVIIDWLPWSHTFGANHNFNMILANGGTLYIDGGKPAPGAFDVTLANLREIPSTIYFNVPRGFDMLVEHLESDKALAEVFFSKLEVIFYAGAALSPATWDRLAAIAPRRVTMTSAWGSTETSPLVTQVHFPIDRAGVIGLPVPGHALAFAPVANKHELRVTGPSVTPGYWIAGGEIEPVPRDELGFYPMGDAGRLADPDAPEQGVVFEGRTAARVGHLGPCRRVADGAHRGVLAARRRRGDYGTRPLGDRRARVAGAEPYHRRYFSRRARGRTGAVLRGSQELEHSDRPFTCPYRATIDRRRRNYRQGLHQPARRARAP
jgi:acyl-CoA synthetase (AMP-forming)/AMP-acid ligase II